MGLLDPTEDPRTMGLLSLGLGMLNSRGNFGQALGQAGPQALDAMRQVKQDQARRQQQEQAKQMQDLQMQQARAQMAQMQAAQQRQQAVEGAYRGAMRSPEQMAMAGGGGPTNAAAQAIPNSMPQIDQSALIRNLMQADPMAAYQMLQPKPEDMKVVGDSLVGIAGGKARELYRAPQKPEAKPEIVKVLGMLHGEGTPAFMEALRQYQVKATTHAPGTSVNVNTDNLGLKPKDRFEMEQKLSGDYGNATKMDRSIVGTAEDITNILKQGGALKDQAAIYKFAKALDPEGAVREADYAAIVRTAGGLDYVKAIVNKALTGEQLVPKQREEMARVVGAMAEVAKNRIGQAQRKTGANAKLYNLNPDNIFSAADNDGWAILPGGK